MENDVIMFQSRAINSRRTRNPYAKDRRQLTLLFYGPTPPCPSPRSPIPLLSAHHGWCTTQRLAYPRIYDRFDFNICKDITPCQYHLFNAGIALKQIPYLWAPIQDQGAITCSRIYFIHLRTDAAPPYIRCCFRKFYGAFALFLYYVSYRDDNLFGITCTNIFCVNIYETFTKLLKTIRLFLIT